jgi:L-asparaginase
MKARVRLIAMGGTISMQGSEAEGITPKLNGEALVSSVPGLEKVAEIDAISPFRLPGASLEFHHIRAVADLIREGVAEGVDGFIVVQGTDTIEETAFLLDALLEGEQPVVVTGAMRGADAAGADGPSNILAAATYAASPLGRGLGAVVVFNDEIHAAQFVRKADTGLLSAFESRSHGPLGRVSEGEVRLGLRPTRPLPKLVPETTELPPVALVQIGFGDDGRLLGALPELGYRGVVLVGLGAGHVPQAAVEKIQALLDKMPVALATRVTGGPVFQRTYGFEGSERDLIARGVIPTGNLGPAKARLLMQLALAKGHDQKALIRLFAEF